MTVRKLLKRVREQLDAHAKMCMRDPLSWKNCGVIADVYSLIDKFEEEMRVIPKRPTWTNRDGEEVLIESMTTAHLNNTIAFIERVRTDRGLEAHAALKAEHRRRMGWDRVGVTPGMERSGDVPF